MYNSNKMSTPLLVKTSILKNNIIVKFFTIFIFLFANQIYADSLTFEKIYSFSNVDDSGYDVETDTNGNIYICGYTTNPFYNGVLLKINSIGNIIWQRIINKPNLVFRDVHVSNDNYIYVCGSYDSTFIAKFDLSGNLIWFNTLFQGHSILHKIIEVANNDFISCGNINNLGIVVKFDSNGRLLDKLNFDLKNIIDVKSIANNSLNDFLVLKYNYFNGIVTPVISKYDNNLKLIKEVEFQENILQILEFTNGYLLCGGGTDTSTNKPKALFIKIDNSLNLQYRNLSEVVGFSMTPFNLFNNKIVYYFESRIGDSVQINYIMTDSLGNTIHKVSRNFFLEDSFLYRSISSKGNFLYFTGLKYFPNDRNLIQKIILTKTNQYFNFKTVNIINSFQFQNSIDIKISPNPFNNYIKLNFIGNLSSNAKIKIYDIRARLVYEKELDFRNTQNELNEVIELDNLSSGIYLLQIQTIDFKISKKLINIK